MIRKALFSALILVMTLGLGAQNMSINQTGQRKNPMWLAQNVLIGNGLTIFPPLKANGTPISQPASVQLSEFYINNPNFPLDTGIAMVTTDAIDVVPGQTGSYASSGATPSANLQTVLSAINSSSTVTNDLVGIQFSFISPADSLKFDYVFASKEYTSYTCSPFNDVFGFFLIGPGINGAPLYNALGVLNVDTVNLATIPGTNVPVAINTINQGYPSGSYPASTCLAANPSYVAHAAYYNANAGGTSIINMEGYTDKFTAKAQVHCGHVYTIKMFIADVSDHAFNSAVFLGAKSFKLPEITLSQSFNQGNTFNDSLIVEGCKPSFLVIDRTGAISDTMTIGFNYGGNAISGVDYQALPSSVTLVPGQVKDSIPIYGIEDHTPEGVDTLRIYMQPVSTDCGDHASQVMTYLIRDANDLSASIQVMAGNDTVTCPGTAVTLQGTPGGGEGNLMSWWETDTVGGDILNITPYQTTTYHYYVWDECADSALVDSLTVFVVPYDSLQTQSDTIWKCGSQTVEIMAVWSGGQGNTAIQWNPPVGPTTPNLMVSPTQSSWYIYEVMDDCGFIARDSVWVGVKPAPYASFSWLSAPGNVLAVDFFNGSSDTLNVAWDFGDGDQSGIANPSHLYSKPGTYTVQLYISDSLGCSDELALDIELRMDHYVYIPSAFTPNGDVVNDQIKIEATGIEGLHWVIMNRWGNVVFETDDLDVAWDGTAGGEPVPQGVYAYRVTIYLPDEKVETQTGFIQVIR